MTESTRIALVTGASRGLGLVIARVLARRGYSLVIGGRDRSALENAAVELAVDAPAVRPIAGDITDAQVRAAMIDAARQLGGLHVLVNNASQLGSIGPLRTFDVPSFGRLFPVNVGAPMVLTQLALPLLIDSRGLIVNITSDAAVAAYPGWGPYGATKAALELLTRTLASELREQGVSAVLVDPGGQFAGGRLALLGLAREKAHEAFGLQPALQQHPRQRLVAGVETERQLLVELAQPPLQIGAALGDLLQFQRDAARLQLLPVHFLFHFPDCLPKQHLGFFQAIQHRIEIGAEQPRQACNECHVVLPGLAALNSNPV